MSHPRFAPQAVNVAVPSLGRARRGDTLMLTSTFWPSFSRMLSSRSIVKRSSFTLPMRDNSFAGTPVSSSAAAYVHLRLRIAPMISDASSARRCSRCALGRPISAGVVVEDSGGLRKVRWKRTGTGKSGGVRVIYFTRTKEGEVVLLTPYAKAKTDNLTGAKLKEIRRALEE